MFPLEDWIALISVVASIFTILGVVLSDDFRDFVKSYLRNRAVRLFLIILVTASLIYFLPKRPKAPISDWPPTSGVLETVQQRGSRGSLRCGVNGYLDGFSIERNNDMSGFDADFCKAVAAAISTDVEFVKLTNKERLDAVEKGIVDILFRNTSWTVGRDLERGINFGPTIYYDEQAILVPINSEIKTISDLQDKKICVLDGTTSKKNIKNYLEHEDIEFTLVTERSGGNKFEDNEVMFQYYGDQSNYSCDAVTSDLSQIEIWLNKKDNSKFHRLLTDLNISQELLSPVFVAGDEQWSQIISYVVYSTIRAAELKINSKNIYDSLESDQLVITSFLGLKDPRIENYIGDFLGIRPDFVSEIIKTVGNYNEIYERNLGNLIPERKNNLLVQNGGLLIAPPFTAPDKV